LGSPVELSFDPLVFEVVSQAVKVTEKFL